MHRVFRPALLALLVAASSALLPAAGPVFWTVASQAEWLKGHASGVSIDAAGRLVAAPPVTVVHDLGAPQAWSLARGTDGAWYAGTGGDGRVVRARGTDVTTILDVEPSAIHAIAVAGTRVYAASSPDGRVHVIEADGSSRVFFDPAEPYIWAMVTDAQNRLWVATGHPATIHRVQPDGTSAVVYRPTARHVVSLAIDQSGRVFAGTDQPARLYRFDASDRPFVVLETALTELRSIKPSPDGGLFVAAIAASGEPGGESAVTGSVTITVGGTQAGTSTTTDATAAPTGRRSVVYRVDASGVWDPLWETTDAIYDLAVIDDRTVLAATGPEGRLYQLGLDGTVVLVSSVDARQVTRLLRDGARTLMVSANPGRVLALNTSPAATGAATYRSPVRDAKTLAQWGSIQWDGSGLVTLQTRSGNTEAPDDSWSDWSAAYSTATGQPIQSPAARFLQWRATFPASTSPAVLTSVTVAYLPRNTRPAVNEITLHPAGVVFQRPFASDESAIAGLDDAIADSRRPPGSDATTPPSLGRRMFQRGLRTFQWKADDADGDRLMYDLHHRREGETTWRELRTGLADPLFVWDTTSVADGRYFVRITASDALGNTADRVLSGQRESDAVDVDNTAPIITATVSGLRVEIRVSDAHSGVHRVDYAIGGQPWQTLRSLDGLADSRDERFELLLPSADAAERLVIRATDVMQNVSSGGIRDPRR